MALSVKFVFRAPARCPLRDHSFDQACFRTLTRITADKLHNVAPCRNLHMFSKATMPVNCKTPYITNCIRVSITRGYVQSQMTFSKTSQTIRQRFVQALGYRLFSTTLPSQATRQAVRRLPYEVDSNVKSDVTVFTYNNDKYYRMMTIFGIVQFFFWGNMAAFSYSSFKTLSADKAQEVFDQDSWWGKILTMQSKYKFRIAFLCMMLGYMVLFLTWIYPQRSVSALTLLKGGKDVRFTTYTHFGWKRDFTRPVDQISCKESRSTSGPWVSLKVKGKWFFYMLDKREGQFHNPTLFDHVIGLKRDLKK